MGCFLACFGSSKDGSNSKRAKRGKRRVGGGVGVGVRGMSPDQTSFTSQSAQVIALPQQDIPVKPPSDLAPNISEKREEESSGSSQRKVRFDSNIIAYEHVSTEEEPENTPEEQASGNAPKADQSESLKEESSVTTSVSSYPPSHRYENCRDSDDEFGYWVDSEESDLDGEGGDSNDLSDDDGGEGDSVADDIDRTSHVPILAGRKSNLVEKSSSLLHQNGLDRNTYIPPVLRPVENLSQWKSVKAKGIRAPSSKQRKENFTSDLETMISSSDNKAFMEASSHVEEKLRGPNNSTQEMLVDASLSTWLTSSGNMSISEKSMAGLDDAVSLKSVSVGSSSPRYLDDRPILGALTVEELRKYSPKSSPRKSPSRSPDEMPLIGTVGTYWCDKKLERDSQSASSFKGIPNTTSKYREDVKVEWHSTPFETRLERALSEGADQQPYQAYTRVV
ncbi:hypothetical protein MLD38_029731 [Melastoma candidum]|uniref:Uncharacterized protein n=1 Tax=Melastoma candidum TaxID=119954 RepID=A0ACB9N727_9MYRT|nr:hypothetical protein MLD38_029731 [Melastoma candidum]